MLSLKFTLPVILFFLILGCKHKIPAPQPGKVVNKKDSVCYQSEVQPILSANCAMSGCHDPITRTDDVNLSDYSSLKQTVSGAKLLKVIQATNDDRMPPAGRNPLSTDQIAIIKTWVNQGMKDGIDCETCDSTAINFTKDIFPLFQIKCNYCHNSQAPLLTTYAEIKVQMDNGKIPCTINWTGSCSAMPKGGAQLPLCQRRQIMKWLAAGAPNN